MLSGSFDISGGGSVDTVALYMQYIVNGLTLGAIYSLIALGYTMVYGILKFINFAHGDILMVGAFIGLLVYTALTGEAADPGAWTIIAFFIAMLVSMVACALLGMLIERVAYKPLRNANRLAPLLSAIGVSFILSNGAAWIFGTQSRRFPYPFLDVDAYGWSRVLLMVFAITVVFTALGYLSFVLDRLLGRTRKGAR